MIDLTGEEDEVFDTNAFEGGFNAGEDDEVFDGEDEEPDQQSLAMFEGDTSTLYPEQRRCLHALLKHRYISAERYPEHWAVLLADPALIRSRLNELFLELEVDRDYQIAFKRQAANETGETLPSLLRDASHTKEETIVMAFLRQRFFAQRQEGEDVVFVDRQALLDEVSDQRPEHSTHRAMDRKRAEKALDSLRASGVLLKTADPERFRISPIIEVLLPIEKLRALWTWLMIQNGTEPPVPDDPDETAHDDQLDLQFDLEEK
ncbi:DUF4194 domain-containing protein [Agromyces sp. CFH 90414]|uniref:DUF4194 domain-containing protein n=1 Tax=Agromyces agglutinans TaxID=2662258 RepID=A0A6I2FAI1_9MICO|nr:DUF4194 domain-containing protein [Agromyces agglutinans]MRG60827.1 DUF4194 domain-containing protein [Agromyces agglutinans]